MDTSSAPRVYPWVAFGLTVGVVAGAVVAVAAWGRTDSDDVTAQAVAVVSGTTVLFGVVVGLAVGQFIRVAGIVRAWRPALPALPALLDAPSPSTNGHGRPDPEPPAPVRAGALFAVLSAIGAILAATVVPLLPAPLVLGVGALALDERVWVRVTASVGIFVAAFGLAGFFVTGVLDGGLAGPVLLAIVMVIGVLEVVTLRRVRPRA